MRVIQVESLTRDYKEGRGVFDLSFEVNKGEAFGFLGPNGAGKTTTIRHLMGFIKPKSGTCTINGLDCWKDSDKIKKTLGYIPGEINFFSDMSGIEFLKFCEKYSGMKDRNRTKEMLDLFELSPKGKINKMSKGMKQKLGIVAAFMNDPDILILDEPTSGLDPLMQSRFIDLISREKENGKTILLSSHMFEEVERTCDRVSIIKDGRLVAIDTTDSLRKKHVKSYTVTLASEAEAASFAKDFNGIRNGNRVNVTTKQTLEEIFLDYYGGER